MTGKELKMQRIMKDIKLKEVSSALQVTDAYVSMMERGKCNIPLQLKIRWKQFLGKEVEVTI